MQMSESAPHNWSAPSAKRPIHSTVSIPGSKSATNRAFVLAALGDSISKIHKPLLARDTELMLQALEKLGCTITRSNEIIEITPMKRVHQDLAIDVGLAGTVMRFVPPLAALTAGVVHFDGNQRARNRPMKTLIDSLKALKISVDDESSGSLPFSIVSDGNVQGGEITIDASESSQFISALLLAGAKFSNGLTIKHVGNKLPSLPHIEMTIDMLNQVGVKVSSIEKNSWKIDPTVIKSKDWLIEPDLSNAGPFIAAAMVTKGEVTITDWPQNTTQAGNAWIEILTKMGAQVVLTEKGLTVSHSGDIKGIDFDLSDVGELTPVLVSIAVLANSNSSLTGISHLRGHETDRLAALVENIKAIGGDADETTDGLIIRPKKLHGGLWKSFDDHRMATAGAVIGLVVEGIIVDDIKTTSKTLPDFENMWTSLVGV
ncbi:MAG: 3-phosphoshikimate 1-carboxyvinyltransferase [Candidatus Nanopelagicales bacterium]|nr:3-phosphoshikimate 1-carboxyvinyltransferase [Candidatus Nanopelagicales bacterium]